MKVATNTNPNTLAGALAEAVKQYHRAEMQSVGAGALNQAIKAIAIARGFVAPHGIDLICTPAFHDLTIDGEERTAIKFIVAPM